MKREQLPLYVIALAILIVGLAFAGVPSGTLLILPLVLVCPLAMMFMMRGMNHSDSHDDHHGDESSGNQDLHDRHDTSGR